MDIIEKIKNLPRGATGLVWCCRRGIIRHQARLNEIPVADLIALADELAALRERIAVMEKDASPWIPINSVEDLPKETGEYVVTMHTPSGLHVTTLRFYGVWHNISDRDTKLRILRHEYWLATSHATQWAVAYMPLPEPYQPAAQAPKAK